MSATANPSRSSLRPGMPWWIIPTAVVFGAVLASGSRQQPTARAEAAPATGAFNETRSTDEPMVAQRRRARQRGRGREATAPQEIPWTGWKDVLWRTYEEIGQDRLMAVAAGVVFYGLLAIFPAITALVSLYGLFADASTIGEHLSFAVGVMPQASFDLVRDQVLRIAGNSGGGLTLGFVFGLLLALWSANAGMKAIFDALNVIYEEDEKRSFITLNLVSLAFTLGAIAAMLAAVGAVVVFPLALTFFGAGDVNPWLVSLLRWPVLAALVIFGLALLYRYGPSRERAEWRWVSIGSLFAALAWIIGSVAFSYYLANFADYNATYGSLGAAIGLMMWMWLSAIVILVGAELNAETEHQTARDSTDGRDQPLGMRGAAMADGVGESHS